MIRTLNIDLGTMTTWRHRLEEFIVSQGLTMKGLSLKAGLSETAVRDIVKRGTSPSIDGFLAICGALGVTPGFLLYGKDAYMALVPIVGDTSPNESWVPSVREDRKMPFDLADEDPIAIRVRGNDMAPAYREGDTLICHRRVGKYIDNLVNLDCAVKLLSGACYIKILKRGTKPGLYTLKSYNPRIDDIPDTKIEWAAPVVWVRRGQA